MSKIKNGGLDQYGAKPFEQQQFRTPGVERVKERTADDRADRSATPVGLLVSSEVNDAAR